MSDSDQFRVDWAVESIVVGTRHRRDLGDIGALAESINQFGLLQPITINRDGMLICGARRLAAIKKLGQRHVNVWMRMGLSDKLSALMAERDDVVLHKQYAKTELAEMYTELKEEIAADNARRKEASLFVDGRNPLSDGDAESAPPSGPRADSRRQAAAMLGGASHFMLEQVAAIQAIAADGRRDPELRRQARLALKEIEDGGAVDPWFHKLRPAVQLDDLDIVANDENEPPEAREAARAGATLIRQYNAKTPMTPEELDKIARAALNRINAARKGKKPKPDTAPKPKDSAPPAPKKKTAKSFMWLWDELADWTGDYDTEAIAGAVPDDKWLRFKQTVAATIEFMQAVDTARAARVFGE
jgi:ParB family chromosome partitioning protein